MSHAEDFGHYIPNEELDESGYIVEDDSDYTVGTLRSPIKTHFLGDDDDYEPEEIIVSSSELETDTKLNPTWGTYYGSYQYTFEHEGFMFSVIEKEDGSRECCIAKTPKKCNLKHFGVIIDSYGEIGDIWFNLTVDDIKEVIRVIESYGKINKGRTLL